MKFLSKYLKKYKDKKELKKSDFGREYGWYIEYNDEIIGELIDYKYTDMFWCSYKIISRNEKWEEIVFDEKIWEKYEFKFLNKKYKKYAEDAYPGFAPGDLIKTKTVGMRLLYLTEL